MNKKSRTEQEWKNELTAEQFNICRKKGTEPAFSGKYYDCQDNGIYVCLCCGNELFNSETKYNSGSGWPSFWQPLKSSIKTVADPSSGMQRTEVVCKECDAHLGHVFEDGPEPTGLRYCINSISLKLNRV